MSKLIIFLSVPPRDNHKLHLQSTIKLFTLMLWTLICMRAMNGAVQSNLETELVGDVRVVVVVLGKGVPYAPVVPIQEVWRVHQDPAHLLPSSAS